LSVSRKTLELGFWNKKEKGEGETKGGLTAIMSSKDKGFLSLANDVDGDLRVRFLFFCAARII